MRVLHVEDDQMIASAIARMLRINYDATVVSAASARAAIAVLEQTENMLGFDLIISDFDLDGDKATDLVAWLRENDPDMLDHMFMLCANDRAGELGLPTLEKPARNGAIIELIDRLALDLRARCSAVVEIFTGATCGAAMPCKKHEA